jgi:hypothetical protein
MSDDTAAPTDCATPPPEAPQAPAPTEEQVADFVAQVQAQAEAPPQLRIDPAMVAETLQRKNAQLMSQLVYDNAVLETALETTQRENGELRAKNAGLREALGA